MAKVQVVVRVEPEVDVQLTAIAKGMREGDKSKAIRYVLDIGLTCLEAHGGQHRPPGPRRVPRIGKQ